MSRENIKKIDLCEICFERKAEYSYYRQIDIMFFGTKVWRGLVCKKCLIELKNGEHLG